jgi:uncharacterized oligopeptide transporter (OPT) family protein
LRKGTILETNICQSVASTVNVPNSGIIFTVPVLYLLNYDLEGARFWLITLAGVVGSILGAAFIIPLRKQLIDIDRLRFPSAVAVAAILKSPGAGPKKSLVLLSGIVVAMLIYLPVGMHEFERDDRPLLSYQNLDWRLRAPEGNQPLERRIDRDGDGQPDLILTNEEIDVGRLIGLPEQVQFIFAIAPFALGAGYLTGRAGLLVLAGGVLAFFVLNPAVYGMGWMPATVFPDEAAQFGYRAFNRPLGIGMLLGGALMGIVFSMPAILAAMKSIGKARQAKTGADELGLKVVFFAAAVAVIFLYVAADLMSGNQPAEAGLLAGLNPHLKNLIIALVGAVWIWFAGIIIAQCTGMTDWSPISGMALLTVVLVMALAGPKEVLGAVLLGAALCVATTCAADMMSDLKTGYLVGAQPRRQQVVELMTVWLGPIISMGTLMLIVESNLEETGKPIGPGTDTVAPQAQALQAIITGIQGKEMPYALYGCGAILGVLLGVGSFPGLGVLVGLSMYLPVTYILTYGVGCLINMLVGMVKGKGWAEEWGMPFCAGLIVGEAMLAMFLNSIPFVEKVVDEIFAR